MNVAITRSLQLFEMPPEISFKKNQEFAQSISCLQRPLLEWWLCGSWLMFLVTRRNHLQQDSSAHDLGMISSLSVFLGTCLFEYFKYVAQNL